MQLEEHGDAPRILYFFFGRACVEVNTRHPIYITPDRYVSQRRGQAVVFILTVLVLFFLKGLADGPICDLLFADPYSTVLWLLLCPS